MTSHSSGGSILNTAKSWFATKSPSVLSPLKSIDATAENLVTGVVKNTTGYIADVLNPLWISVKNAGSLISPSAYQRLGWRNISKSIGGVLSHTIDSANNLIASSTVRGLDHAYTHIITNSIVDITSGSTDRVPVIGKFAGNTIKATNVILAAPIRFLARVWEKTIDPLVDWMKESSAVQGKERHITTKASHGSHH